MIKPSDVTIIIPTLFETREQQYALHECLISLYETAIDIPKIIVKNNDYNDRFLDMSSNVNEKHIILEEQGQCKAVNAAIATTNTPWIFITNDDMIYPPGWWEKLTKPIDEKIMCISPKLIEPRPGAPTFETYFCGGAGGDFDKEKWLEFAKNYKGEGLRTGFNFPLLIKRELWDLIGGYDINYDPWGSNGDSDLQYKIMLAGIQPYQNTNCIVYHFSQTSGTFEPRNDSYRFRNYAYFKEKWGFERTDNRIWESDFKIPSKEEGRIFLPHWENKYAR